VVLSLAQGQAIKDYPPDVSSAFTPIFQDFLEKCLTIDEKQRWSPSDLLKHEFIKVCLIWSLAIEGALKASQLIKI